MSAVTDSLSWLENEHEDILDKLHELSREPSLDASDLEILEDLKDIVRDWDRIFGGDFASDTIGKKVAELEESTDKLESIKQLEWLVDPLRHYVVGLEKFQLEENLESVTRAAMAIETDVLE